jgi:pyruvate dehydrogenase E1 component beta subunit
MTTVTYREAVARGIAQEMRRDESVVFLGEDVAAAGGVFKATVGLLEEFGPQRVRDTPISEQAILGAAMGAAMTGLRPVAEIMFSDFFAVCWDLVANEIAKSRYMSDGQVSFPLVIRCANGAGVRFGAQHSQSVENWAMAVPGLKVVAPSNPQDVIGLLAAAIRDPDPVLFFEQKSLYATKGDVGDGEIVDELGRRRCSARAGTRPSWRSAPWSAGPRKPLACSRPSTALTVVSWTCAAWSRLTPPRSLRRWPGPAGCSR